MMADGNELCAQLVEDVLQTAEPQKDARPAVASFGAYRSRPLTEIPNAALSAHADALTAIIRAKLHARLSNWRIAKELVAAREEQVRRAQGSTLPGDVVPGASKDASPLGRSARSALALKASRGRE